MAAGPLIAIIDDDQSMLSAITGLLQSASYGVEGFTSAETFLQCGPIDRFACLITDIQLPGMSGIDLQQHLTAHQFPAPVIMITARDHPGLEARALAGGAYCFLRKPFEADLLLNCLERVLKI